MSRPQRSTTLAASLLALVLAAPAGAAAQGASPSLPVDSAVTTGTLPNGMHYYIRANGQPEHRAELRLVVNAGSVLEDDDQRGLAHIVEHMAFNGTRHFERNELVSFLESAGMRFGADLNAYTGFDETVYMLQIPTDSASVLARSFDVLEDWAWGQRFRPEDVARERGVVMEEWRLGRGANERMVNEQLPIIFRGSKYADRLPIGTPESIQAADSAKLRRFYDEWYRPDLMAVVAVGDFDVAAVERLIRQHFSAIPEPPSPRPRPVIAVPSHEATTFAIATDPEATRSGVAIEYLRPAEANGTEADYRRDLVERLVEGMLDARLAEIAQKADPPFLGAGSSEGSLARATDAFTLGAGVKDGGIAQGLEALLTEAERVRRHGFTASELEREKQNLLRGMERAFAERNKTSSAVFADEYVRNYLQGEPIPGIGAEYALARRLLPEIQLGEVNQSAQALMAQHDRVVVANAPKKPNVPVPTEAELRDVFQRVEGAQIAAYTDDTPDAPLLPTEPPLGSIVAEKEYPAVGVTEWRLSNGVRVLLKPTDFKADQVLFQAYSPGGTSLVADSDYIAALTAVSAVSAGGLGAFSQTQLRKELAGKAVAAVPTLGTLEEGLSGSASPSDLETLFQLVYLSFTAPRADTAAFTSLKTRLHDALADRGASPEAAFGDTLAATLAQYDPRGMPITAERLAAMDLGKSMRIYRDRFGDAGDFTFVFVGSFDVDHMRPLVARYLASLPTHGRRETWRDDGVHPPRGVVKKVVRRGVEPKSLTQIVFTGPAKYSPEQRYELSSLDAVVEMRLRDVLREDLSGTYGVQVGSRLGRDPRPTYTFSIGFGSAPDRAEELTKVLFGEIRKLQKDGPTPDEVRKVAEQQRRSLETALRQNGYWLGRIVQGDHDGQDFKTAVYGAGEPGRLTAQLVRDAARRYLRTDNYVQVRLMPERQEQGGRR